MAWTAPTLVEICIGLEINGYLPADSDRFQFVGVRCATPRRARVGPTVPKCREKTAPVVRIASEPRHIPGVRNLRAYRPETVETYGLTGVETVRRDRRT